MNNASSSSSNGGSSSSTSNGGSSSANNSGVSSTGNSVSIVNKQVRQNPGTAPVYGIACQGNIQGSTGIASGSIQTRWQGCEATAAGVTLAQTSRFVNDCNQSYQIYYDGRLAMAAGNKFLAKAFEKSMMPKTEWCAANVSVGYSNFQPPANVQPVQAVPVEAGRVQQQVQLPEPRR